MATQISQCCKSGTWSGAQTHYTEANLPKRLPCHLHGNHHSVGNRPILRMPGEEESKLKKQKALGAAWFVNMAGNE